MPQAYEVSTSKQFLSKELVCLGLIECQERIILFKTPRTQFTSHLTLLQSALRSWRELWVERWHPVDWALRIHKLYCDFRFYLPFGSIVMYAHLESKKERPKLGMASTAVSQYDQISGMSDGRETNQKITLKVVALPGAPPVWEETHHK